MAKDIKDVTIIQFEGDDFYRSVADLILFNVGVKVSHYARNRAETSKLLSEIASGKIKPEIAIVDTLIEDNHTDGEKVAAKLKELHPSIRIIAYTIIPDVTWADYVAIKSNLDPQRTLVNSLAQALGVDLNTKGGADLS